MRFCNKCGQEIFGSSHSCGIVPQAPFPDQVLNQNPPIPNLDNKILATLEQILETLTTIMEDVDRIERRQG